MKRIRHLRVGLCVALSVIALSATHRAGARLQQVTREEANRTADAGSETVPVAREELITLVAVSAGGSDSIGELKTRGVSFTVDEEFLWELRAVDATDEVVHAVRAASFHRNYVFASTHFGLLGDALEPDLRRLLKAQSENPVLHQVLGRTLSWQARPRDAIAAYRKALREKPDYARARFYLGIELSCQGDWKQAVTELRQAVQLQPALADAHVELGKALSVGGFGKEALSEMRQGVCLAPDDAYTHVELGLYLTKQGSLDEGLGELREALRLAPDSALAKMSLKRALAKKEGLGSGVRFSRMYKVDDVHDRAWFDTTGELVYLLYHWGYEHTVVGPVLNPFRQSTVGVLEWRQGKTRKTPYGKVVPGCGSIQSIWPVANSPDVLIAACGVLYVADRNALTVRRQLGKISEGAVVGMSGDGSHVAVESDAGERNGWRVVLYETSGWVEEGEWVTPEKVKHLLFSGDGLLATVEKQGQCELWGLTVPALQSPRKLPVVISKCDYLTNHDLAVVHGKRVAAVYSTSEFRGIREWNLETGTLSDEIPVAGEIGGGLTLAASPDRKFIAGAFLSSAVHLEFRTWDILTGEVLYEDKMLLPWWSADWPRLQVSRDGRYVLLEAGYRLAVYEVSSPSPPR